MNEAPRRNLEDWKDQQLFLTEAVGEMRNELKEMKNDIYGDDSIRDEEAQLRQK